MKTTVEFDSNNLVWNYEVIRDICGDMYKHLRYGTGTINKMLWRIYVFPEALRIFVHNFDFSTDETASARKKELEEMYAKRFELDDTVHKYVLNGSDSEERLNRAITRIYTILYSGEPRMAAIADGILQTKKYQAWKESMNLENPVQARNLLMWMSRHTSVDVSDVVQYVHDVGLEKVLSGED